MAVAQHLQVSRERAQALILAGEVKLDGAVQRKAGLAVPADACIEVQEQQRYVSRGGQKLERALSDFDWSPADLHCLDVGASTGGFTDCLLQHGAASVTALDVGYGQLAWGLRQDSRVRVVERTNFRHADPHALGAPFAFLTVDVSFISVAKLSAQLRAALSVGGRLVALIKPQFEAGRAAVGKGGVVRDHAVQRDAIDAVLQGFAGEQLQPEKLTYSPLKGPAGNIEFLLGAQAIVGGSALARPDFDVAGVVRKAHESLD
ncbi:MAG: TlyA family RNA methyltransferase [Candidatus Eremiobacteraeota bacterium]|nr:TlyA family RNA methyltransferase [Candidatus Eremiobacteraeota bacterium]